MEPGGWSPGFPILFTPILKWGGGGGPASCLVGHNDCDLAQPVVELAHSAVGLAQPHVGLAQPVGIWPSPAVGMVQLAVGLAQLVVNFAQPAVGLWVGSADCDLAQPVVGLAHSAWLGPASYMVGGPCDYSISPES